MKFNPIILKSKIHLILPHQNATAILISELHSSTEEKTESQKIIECDARVLLRGGKIMITPQQIYIL